MRSKVTIVLLFLNVVLFFYIFQYEEKWRAEQKTLEARRRVLGPEAASIDSLARTSRTGDPVKLVKRGESWWLTQPYEWPAEPNALSRIVNELQFLEHETSFAVADLARSKQTLADYGLEQPALTLTFTSAGRPYTLQIGDDTKIGGRLYVLSPDRTRIHVVGRSLVDSIGLSLGELRAPSIFSIPVFEVRSLNVQAAAPSNVKVRLRRDAAGRWGFESPINARASKSAVEVTINALNALNAKNFLDAANPRLEKAGLEAPTLRVTLEGNARRETLLLGNSTGSTLPAALPGNPAVRGVSGTNTGPAAAGNGAAEVEYFARIEDKSAVFTTIVPQPLLDVLRAAQEALRDPRVLDFEPGTVTALTLTAPAQPELALQKLEAATAGPGAGWQVVTRLPGQAPLTTAADTRVIEELLQKIYLLSAQDLSPGLPKFLSDAPSAADLENWGFNRPEREITLSLSTGGGVRGNEPSTLTLQVGVSPDKPGVAFARVTNAPFVYQILPDILGETPAAARHYRQRLLRELPEGARITGLTLTDLATNEPVISRQIAEGDKNWDAALATEPEARRRAFATLLLQLHKLQARRFTADTFNPDHAETPQGPRPWKYRLEATLSFPGANAAAAGSTSTLLLTERLGGTTLLAGTAEFGGVVFETSQELLDALFTLTYAGKNDPGPAAAAPAATTGPAKAPVPAKPVTEAPPATETPPGKP
ncbi:MAG: DUF4340 domain-containing protein [Opitutae bacterium]|nr:DUF4340 domain-containing protein [Opitutae bacterium]